MKGLEAGAFYTVQFRGRKVTARAYEDEFDSFCHCLIIDGEAISFIGNNTIRKATAAEELKARREEEE